MRRYSLRPTPETHGVNRALLVGFLMLQVGMAGWSFGSIYQRRKAGKAHPVIAGGVQQLAAALVLLPFCLIIPQPAGPLEHARRYGAPVI